MKRCVRRFRRGTWCFRDAFRRRPVLLADRSRRFHRKLGRRHVRPYAATLKPDRHRRRPRRPCSARRSSPRSTESSTKTITEISSRVRSAYPGQRETLTFARPHRIFTVTLTGYPEPALSPVATHRRRTLVHSAHRLFDRGLPARLLAAVGDVVVALVFAVGYFGTARSWYWSHVLSPAASSRSPSCSARSSVHGASSAAAVRLAVP